MNVLMDQVQYPSAEEAEEPVAADPTVLSQEQPTPAQGPQAQSSNQYGLVRGILLGV